MSQFSQHTTFSAKWGCEYPLMLTLKLLGRWSPLCEHTGESDIFKKSASFFITSDSWWICIYVPEYTKAYLYTVFIHKHLYLKLMYYSYQSEWEISAWMHRKLQGWLCLRPSFTPTGSKTLRKHTFRLYRKFFSLFSFSKNCSHASRTQTLGIVDMASALWLTPIAFPSTKGESDQQLHCCLNLFLPLCESLSL